MSCGGERPGGTRIDSDCPWKSGMELSYSGQFEFMERPMQTEEWWCRLATNHFCAALPHFQPVSAKPLSWRRLHLRSDCGVWFL